MLLSSVSLASLDDIQLPPGFHIEEYADVPNARSLALGDRGTLFVSTRKSREVYAVVENADGSTRTIELLNRMNWPNGIAVYDGDLYVAEIDRVYRYRDIEDHLDSSPQGELLDIDLPSEKSHGWRYIGFGPDNKLYIAIGAPCNICDERGFAQIIRMNPDGSGREIYASGVRNSVGFTWHPVTGELWFTDNGRDMLGDDLPPDELNRAPAGGKPVASSVGEKARLLLMECNHFRLLAFTYRFGCLHMVRDAAMPHFPLVSQHTLVCDIAD